MLNHAGVSGQTRNFPKTACYFCVSGSSWALNSFIFTIYLHRALLVSSVTLSCSCIFKVLLCANPGVLKMFFCFFSSSGIKVKSMQHVSSCSIPTCHGHESHQLPVPYTWAVCSRDQQPAQLQRWCRTRIDQSKPAHTPAFFLPKQLGMVLSFKTDILCLTGGIQDAWTELWQELPVLQEIYTAHSLWTKGLGT